MYAIRSYYVQTSWDDIEVSDQGLGFDDLSLEKYRQDLFEEFNKDKAKYQRMPKGVYSGFKSDKNICSKDGIIALLGYPSKPEKQRDHIYRVFDIIYIDYKGEMVLLNQKEVLDAITYHKDRERFVSDAIDKGNESSIQELVNALKNYLDSQATETEVQSDGTRITSYNVCYTKLLRDMLSLSTTSMFGKTAGFKSQQITHRQ